MPAPESGAPVRDLVIWLVTVGWFAAVSAGFTTWHGAERPPLDPTPAPGQPASGAWTLMMFVHPHCPCSRAVRPIA